MDAIVGGGLLVVAVLGLYLVTRVPWDKTSLRLPGGPAEREERCTRAAPSAAEELRGLFRDEAAGDPAALAEVERIFQTCACGAGYFVGRRPWTDSTGVEHRLDACARRRLRSAILRAIARRLP